MSGRNILVVVLDDDLQQELGSAITLRGDDVEQVHVVAPLHLAPVDWLATDEDASRAAAARRAASASLAVGDRGDRQPEAGEADPVLAVEDALRVYPADEILLVADAGADDRGIEASLRRLGLPVGRIPAARTSPHPDRSPERWREIASGRSQATPLVLLAGVNLFLLVVVAAALLAAFALYAWLG
jgi:hypothetical protein